MRPKILKKVSWVAAELGMSGEGNDEEIVKLSIEGKVSIQNRKHLQINFITS